MEVNYFAPLRLLQSFAEKATPAQVAGAILDGVESGSPQIFADPFAVEFGEQFEASPRASERQIAAMVAAG